MMTFVLIFLKWQDSKLHYKKNFKMQFVIHLSPKHRSYLETKSFRYKS